MLKGKIIINTRPDGFEDYIGKALTGFGAEVFQMPLIEIQPVEIPKIAVTNITKNNTYQWLVFTSKNGVDHFFNQIKINRNTKSFPFKTAVFGKRTAMALEEKGFNPDLVNRQNTSADLVKELYSKLKANEKVLLVLGDLANDLMEESLRTKVSVERLNVYHTHFIQSVESEILKRIEQDNYDMILFTSPSGFNSFKYHADKLINLSKLKIACIGPTTEDVILKEGIKPLFVANPSGMNGLINGILNYYSTSSLKEDVK